MASLRTRADIDPRYQWDLTHIYADLDAWEKDYAEVSALADAYARYDGHVAEEPRQAIRDFFALDDRVTPVFCYAMLRQEADNGDSEAQALKDRARALIVKVSTITACLQPELLAMDDAALQALMADPDMADYDAYLRAMLREKPHTLPKEQEADGHDGRTGRRAGQHLHHADQRGHEVPARQDARRHGAAPFGKHLHLVHPQ